MAEVPLNVVITANSAAIKKALRGIQKEVLGTETKSRKEIEKTDRARKRSLQRTRSQVTALGTQFNKLGKGLQARKSCREQIPNLSIHHDRGFAKSSSAKESSSLLLPPLCPRLWQERPSPPVHGGNDGGGLHTGTVLRGLSALQKYA